MQFSKITRAMMSSSAMAFILTALIYLTTKSIRWRCIDKGGIKYLNENPGKGVILVNWHSRILGLGKMPGDHCKTNYVSSPSRDGKFIARIVARFGMTTIWGSSNRQAVSLYREMIRKLKNGEHIGITPDGPRGPARMAAPGVVAMAKSSGARIIPLAYSTSRMRRLRTWDRLFIPLPFSRGVEYWGKPLSISKSTDTETARRALEDALNEATAEADACFGHPPDHAAARYGKAKKKR